MCRAGLCENCFRLVRLSAATCCCVSTPIRDKLQITTDFRFLLCGGLCLLNLQRSRSHEYQNVEPAAQAEDSQLPPPLQLPEPTGSYPVGTTTYDFLAPNRDEIYTPQPNDKRELVVQFWYPSEVVSGATPASYLSEVVAQTYLDGAAFYLDGNPVVALMLRHDRIDAFWFTLKHELGHIIAGHRGMYLDNFDECNVDDEEDAANQIARD